MRPACLFNVLPEHHEEAKALAEALNIPLSCYEQRAFPDGETYLRLQDKVQGYDCFVYCTLNDPDPKLLPLIFLAEVLREMGAHRVVLIAPYLAYMRQDKRFLSGECVTSRHFASLLSRSFDYLVTVDPHLHRYHHLDEIYGIPSHTLSAASAIASWLNEQDVSPVLVGPDSESEQWVQQVAMDMNVPYQILEKTRHGDFDVSISIPEVETYRHHTPVLIDDIISSGQTMLETLGHLAKAGLPPAICIGVHGLFSADAWPKLKQAHTRSVVTSNSVRHPSNAIDLVPSLAAALRQWRAV